MVNHSGYEENNGKKRDCIYCGCSKDKIKKRNSGPIIKIQCQECGYIITRGLMSWHHGKHLWTDGIVNFFLRIILRYRRKSMKKV